MPSFCRERFIGFLALAFVPFALAEAPAHNGPALRASAPPRLGPRPFDYYFRPTPLQGALATHVWGATTVGPRDPHNGLEDATMTFWNYWDGKILKGSDGRYRMFASRWNQTSGHEGWEQSLAIRAIGASLLGPYRDMGLTWPNNEGGKGHNVTALRLPKGGYAVVVSETRNGDVFNSSAIDGPWHWSGRITVDQRAYRSVENPSILQNAAPPVPWRASNVSLIARPDHRFEIIQRSGQILLSGNGILGPYKVMGDSIYRNLRGLPQNDMIAFEDPLLWYSGGWYHVIVNHWRNRRAYHLISRDGVTKWMVQGLAYQPGGDFVRYTNGVVNHWNKLERPSVVIENGHVIAMTFAVVDVPKEQETGANHHGSKVIVVPFDGAAMDRDLMTADRVLAN